MNILEALKRVDRDRTNTSPADMQVLGSACNIVCWYSQEFGERVTKHFLTRWLCTDTWVGSAAYYMDGEPIAYSHQAGRKCNEDFKFVSKEAFDKVSALIVKLNSEMDGNSCEILKGDEDIPDFYKLSYASQAIAKEGFLDGRAVEIATKWIGGSEVRAYYWDKERDISEEIDIEKIDFPLMLVK